MRVSSLVFWDVAPCSHVEVDRRFRDTYCLYHRPDDGGSTLLDIFLIDVNVDGVRLCLWTAAINGPIGRLPGNISAWTPTVEWNWQGKTEWLSENAVPVPFCPQKIPHGLNRERTPASSLVSYLMDLIKRKLEFILVIYQGRLIFFSKFSANSFHIISLILVKFSE
jgi:hypothetical protein